MFKCAVSRSPFAYAQPVEVNGRDAATNEAASPLRKNDLELDDVMVFIPKESFPLRAADAICDTNWCVVAIA